MSTGPERGPCRAPRGSAVLSPRPSFPVLLLTYEEALSLPSGPNSCSPSGSPTARVLLSLSERPSSSLTFHRKPVLTAPTSMRSSALTLGQP